MRTPSACEYMALFPYPDATCLAANFTLAGLILPMKIA